MPNKKKTKPGRGFIDKYKQSKKFSASMQADKESNEEPRPNMTSEFKKIPNYKKAASQAIGAGITPPILPKKKQSAGTPPMAFRMPPFPKLSEEQKKVFDQDGNDKIDGDDLAKLRKKGITRYTEEDGVLKREVLQPLNRMGAVPFQRNEMPMAYKRQVYKSTGSAKAVPFTAIESFEESEEIIPSSTNKSFRK